MRTILSVFLVVAFALVSFVANAEERGTKEEAIALTEKAIEYFKKHGAEALIKKINSKDKSLQNKDLYFFVSDLDGVNRAHGVKPHMVGKNFGKMKDTTGKYFVQEMVDLAKAGKSGWIDYSWPDPKSNKISYKSSYVVPLGKKYLIGVGVYIK